MKLELDTLTVFTIKDALDYYRKVSEYDKESRELAYRSFLESWFESMRAEEFDAEMCREINEKTGNPYLDYLNEVGGDGLDFHGIMNGKIVETVTKEQLKEPTCSVPKLPYIAYKMVNGEKIHIHAPGLERYRNGKK